MAISTIGTNALASSAVTRPKIGYAGALLQVVNASIATDVSTSSTSYGTTGLYATITPSSTSSKIICLASASISYIANSGDALGSGFYRGTSGEGSGSIIGANPYYLIARANTMYQPVQMMYVDSPSSTSALTYTVMHKSTAGGVVGWCYGFGSSNRGTLILMEIAG